MGNKLSIHLCQLLRHRPEKAGLDIDEHGWCSTKQLIDGVNNEGLYRLDLEILKEIVAKDNKGRYRFNEDFSRIKACQGHSIPWVIPEMEYTEPPEYLYHGTTTEALELIMESRAVSKMNRHAVHMQADPGKAWQSACRRRGKKGVLLKIAAREMHENGFVFGVTENEVWCTETVPAEYIAEEIYKMEE